MGCLTCTRQNHMWPWFLISPKGLTTLRQRRGGKVTAWTGCTHSLLIPGSAPSRLGRTTSTVHTWILFVVVLHLVTPPARSTPRFFLWSCYIWSHHLHGPQLNSCSGLVTLGHTTSMVHTSILSVVMTLVTPRPRSIPQFFLWSCYIWSHHLHGPHLNSICGCVTLGHTISMVHTSILSVIVLQVSNCFCCCVIFSQNVISNKALSLILWLLWKIYTLFAALHWYTLCIFGSFSRTQNTSLVVVSDFFNFYWNYSCMLSIQGSVLFSNLILIEGNLPKCWNRMMER